MIKKSVVMLWALGVSGAAIIHVPADSLSIQTGLNGALEGDTVLVAPDTYYENIEWPATQGIDLLSEQGADSTIIDGMGFIVIMIGYNGSVDTTTVISGFTIRNGWSYWSGGIDCNESSPVISDNVITGNGADGTGGGIGCYFGSPVIVNNIITANHAAEGGGIGCYGGGASMVPVISHNTITYNRAYAGGGGIYCGDCDPIISYNTLDHDSADWVGGAIYSYYYASPHITHNVITLNHADYQADGIFCEYSSFPVIDSNDIYDNGFGVYNADSSGIVMAENNWWGDVTGPYHPDSNATGLGDSVSDYVDFIPWLTEPANPEEICGDANGSQTVTSADGYQILNHLGDPVGFPISSCWAANVNGDAGVTSADGYHLLNFLGSGPGLNCQPCD